MNAELNNDLVLRNAACRFRVRPEYLCGAGRETIQLVLILLRLFFLSMAKWEPIHWAFVIVTKRRRSVIKRTHDRFGKDAIDFRELE